MEKLSLFVDEKGMKILTVEEKFYRNLMKRNSSDEEIRELENDDTNENKAENG